MSVVRRGARCGGRECGRTYPHARRPKPCVARWAGRPTRVVDSKVTPPGPSRSKPHTPRAERRRVRLSCGDVLMCLFTHNAHGAVGVANARRSARPLRGDRRNRDAGAPGADQTTRAAQRWLKALLCDHGSLRRRPRAGGDPEQKGDSLRGAGFPLARE
jgi:hypothetical protein